MQYIKSAVEAMRRPFVAIIICALLFTIGCCEDENENPVTPNNNSYDTTQYSLIPAGTFIMGNSTANQEGLDNELPAHRVTITHPFLMGKTEVTQRQYEVLMGSNPSSVLGSDLPVDNVMWQEAVLYCNLLSLHEGRDTCYEITGNVFTGLEVSCNFQASGSRLPTEAEWEYACRAGTDTDFYTGNQTESGFNAMDSALNRAGWYGTNSRGAQPVGLKEANGFDLYDMHGNAQEWCWDWKANYTAEECTDPVGPKTGQFRINRGGSWQAYAEDCRSSRRTYNYLNERWKDHGFRVVRRY
jgi:formylglycine-generating enzyme required for sulfatase activity